MCIYTRRDSHTNAQCCICGNDIDERFWCCQACERALGLSGPVSTWPESAKELRRMEQRERRRRGRDVRVWPISAFRAEERAMLDDMLYSSGEHYG